MKKILITLLVGIFLISFASGWELQKTLVQIEVDENYPCHIENGDTIVCPPISNQKIDEWKNKISNLKGEEKDLGKIKDNEIISKLNSKKTLYEGKITKEIDLTKEYREKVNVYDKNFKTISIGFATNVFAVSGTPLENFEVNNVTGVVRYRPLNMTWLSFTGGTSHLASLSSGTLTTPRTRGFTLSTWNLMSSSATSKGYISASSYSSKNRFQTHFEIDGRVSASMGGSAGEGCRVTTTNPLNNSEWYNIIIKGESNGTDITNISIYVNGIFNNLSNCLPGYTITSFGHILGRHSDGSVDNKVNQLRYYNKSLTDEEILKIYENNMKVNKTIFNTDSDSFLRNYFLINENKGLLSSDIISDKIIYSSVNNIGTWENDGIYVDTLGYDVNISIVNISNALILWDNGTLIENNYTGNKTFTFYDAQTIYILENYEEGYLSHLKLNENLGTTAYDSSGNNNHGAISGATWQNDGVTVTLVEDSDYILSDDKFTISNINYAWSGITVGYDYIVISPTVSDEVLVDFITSGENISGVIPNIGTILGISLLLIILISIITYSIRKLYSFSSMDSLQNNPNFG